MRFVFLHRSNDVSIFNYFRQFHFATVLSPWIRRALVAGGFGVGTSTISAPYEVAPVVSHYVDNRDNFLTETQKPDDTESHRVKHDLDSQESHSGDHLSTANKAPLTAVDTPFIHFDLIQAVDAAERSLKQSSLHQHFKQ